MLQNIVADADALRIRFLELMDEDSAAYDGIMAARSHLADDDTGGVARRGRIERATVDALAPPTSILKLALYGTQLAYTLAGDYYTGTASDLGIAANALIVAARGAYLTIHMNLNALPKSAKVTRAHKKARQNLEETLDYAMRVYDIAGGALVSDDDLL
jgi:formiminotetrahydrofolate cyclodeaminase